MQLLKYYVDGYGYLASSNKEQKYALIRFNNTFILKHKINNYIDENGYFNMVGYTPPYSDFYINYKFKKDGHNTYDSFIHKPYYDKLSYIFEKIDIIFMFLDK